MGEFADALEAKAAESTASEAPAPADSGSSPPVTSTPSSPDPAPSVPGEGTPSPTTPPGAPPASAPAAAAPPAQAQMVRYEALKEARAQAKALKESYGWLPPDRAPHVRQFVENFQRDPVQTLVGELQLLLQHPQYGPQLQALMGPNGGDDPEPENLWTAPDGTPVVSPKWTEWRERQLQKQFSEKLRPLEQYVQQHQQQAQIAELKEKADAKAKALLEPYLGDPHFNTHRADIRARFQEYVGEMPGEVALHRAYVEIIREKVLPTLSTQSAQNVVRTLNQKPGATGPNPARPTAAAAPRKKFADFRDAMEAGVIGR